MSKKTAERFQDPLEDQGWQQMRILLDQEMPEKKRRFIWWPWLGATGTAALLLFSGYQLFFNQSTLNELEHSAITKTERI